MTNHAVSGLWLMNRLAKRFYLIISLLTFFLFQNGFSIEITGKIDGVVIDSLTNRPLSQANIRLIKSQSGTTSDSSGKFLIRDIKTGIDTLVVKYMGYLPVQKIVQVRPGQTVHVKILLRSTTIQLPEVEVSAWRYPVSSNMIYIEPNIRIIEQNYLQTMPVAITPDLFRTLQTLPGITVTNDLSPQLQVRGGSGDQNLVLLDGAPVYYPYHFFSFFSNFNIDLIQNIYFSPGGFSVRYGDKLSSVLDIQTIYPQNTNINQINLSFIESDMTLSGRFFKKLGWLVSGRLSHFDLFEKITGESVPISFYDLYTKLDFQINREHFLQLFIFHSRDSHIIEDTTRETLISSISSEALNYDRLNEVNLGFYNTLYSIVWEKLFFPGLRSRVQITRSEYNNNFYNDYFARFPENLPADFFEAKINVEKEIQQSNAENGIDIQNLFRDTHLKANFEYQLRPDFHLAFGGQHSQFKLKYQWQGEPDFGSDWMSLFFDYAPTNYFNYSRQLTTTVLYLETIWKFPAWLHLRPGIRLTRWNYLSNFILEPRLNVQFDFRKNWKLKLSIGKFSQGLSTALENNLVCFLPIFFANENSQQPEIATHCILNLEHQLQDNIRFSITGYYKKFSYLLKSTPYLPQFVQIPGNAWGLENEFRWENSRRSILVNYCWSKSQRVFENLTYNINSDIRHRFQIIIKQDLGKKWSLGLYWEFHTGQPYSPLEAHMFYRIYSPTRTQDLKYYDFYAPVPINLPHQFLRYPAYHRLDINLSKKIILKKWTLAPYFSIRDAYYRRNVYYYRNLSVRYDIGLFTEKTKAPTLARESFSLPLIPTIGLRIGF